MQKQPLQAQHQVDRTWIGDVQKNGGYDTSTTLDRWGVDWLCAHFSKGQLLARMIELGIDGDLITWTGSFLTNRKVQLVIDGQDNYERDIETGIPQGSLVSPILSLIYISGVFNKVSETSPLVTSLSFAEDLGFIASGSSVKEIVKALEKVAKEVIEWGK